MIRNSPHTAALNHWGMLKHLDDDSKIELIMLLSQSLKHTADKKEVSASDLYGIWGDDGMSDEEFVNDLKKARTFSQDIIEL